MSRPAIEAGEIGVGDSVGPSFSHQLAKLSPIQKLAINGVRGGLGSIQIHWNQTSPKPTSGQRRSPQSSVASAPPLTQAEAAIAIATSLHR